MVGAPTPVVVWRVFIRTCAGCTVGCVGYVRPKPWGDGVVSKYSNGGVSGEEVLSWEKILRQVGIGKSVLHQHLQSHMQAPSQMRGPSS